MTNSQSEKGKSAAPVVAAAVTGLVVGVAIGVAVGTLGAGDEAPIKVKNGTMELHVVHKSQKFKDKNNDKKHFEINVGSHGNEFEVYFAASANQSGCQVRRAVGNTIEVATTQQNKVTISVQGNKTQLEAEKDLTLDPNTEQLLTYGGTDDYITAITVKDGSTLVATCTLSGKDPDLYVALLDR